MSQVEILSGLGGKLSAAICVRHQGHSLLLDAGGPLHAEERCEWVRHTGPLDAILISHDHPDHIGSVAELPWDIPLYCTPAVATALPPERRWHPLPQRGTLSILGIEVTTGRAGHSYGGVWLHLDIGEGVFYSGDASMESQLFAFDTPPPAKLALLDASYGLYDCHQIECQSAIRALLSEPAVLPLPLSGRAIEMAIWLSQLEQTQAVDWTMDAECQQVLNHWAQCDADALRPGVDTVLKQLLNRDWPRRASIMLVADHGDGYHDWPEHHLLHTGYLTPDRQARVAAGVEYWRRWNVHLRASDLIQLADTLEAQQLVPLFTSFTSGAAWRDWLGSRLCINNTLDVNDATETEPFYLSASR